MSEKYEAARKQDLATFHFYASWLSQVRTTCFTLSLQRSRGYYRCTLDSLQSIWIAISLEGIDQLVEHS